MDTQRSFKLLKGMMKLRQVEANFDLKFTDLECQFTHRLFE